MQEDSPITKIIAFIAQIWPRVYRIVMTVLYYTLTFIKNAVLYMINQIRNA